jgi:hypothetical protein
MSVLSDFVEELAAELDRQRGGGPLLPGFPPDKWMDFFKLFAAIDRGETPAMVELREKLERIVEQHDLPLRERCRQMLPLLLPHLPPGSAQ